jgi:hypothetical protein
LPNLITPALESIEISLAISKKDVAEGKFREILNVSRIQHFATIEMWKNTYRDQRRVSRGKDSSKEGKETLTLQQENFAVNLNELESIFFPGLLIEA